MSLPLNTGEEHYNCISALIKSMRGGDDNAAIYWLSRMLEGGEDPKFIARRLIVFASEDVGEILKPFVSKALCIISTVDHLVTSCG